MAEALGLVSGVLGLIGLVDEHFREVAIAFSHHRMFVTEAANIASTLKIQGVIFRAANRSLLEHCIGEELAAQMLDNEDHRLWSDMHLHCQLSQRLGDSLDATIECMKLIDGQLKMLDKYRDKMRRTAPEAKKREEVTFALKRINKQARTQLKFAHSELPFQEILDCLRRFTQDFRVLIEQRVAMPERRKPHLKIGEAIDKSIGQFRLVQAAAKDLYAALSFSWLGHSEQKAYLGVQTGQNSSPPTFRFGFELHNYSVGCTAFSKNPFWFRCQVITESVHNCDSLAVARLAGSLAAARLAGSLAAARLAGSLAAARSAGLVECLELKHLADVPPHLEGTRRPKKTVRFRSATPPPSKTAPHDEEPSAAARNSPCDLGGLLQNPCFFSSSGETTHSVGSTEYVAGSSHSLLTFHVDAIPPDPQGRSFSLVSLAALLAGPQGVKKRARLSFFDRVRLARLLAIAVLRFHATPWLKDTLRSRNVFLYSIDSGVLNTISVRDEIYLQTTIKRPDYLAPEDSSSPSRPIVRNPLLFALGVMLLELAFEAPLRSLQKSTDVTSPKDQNTDYYIADRVRLTVASVLGPRYADIVRKCIHCDFGRGDDLNTTGLQQSLYVEVIQELAEMEAKFHGYDLGG